MERYLLSLFDNHNAKAKYINYEPDVIHQLDKIMNILDIKNQDQKMIHQYIQMLHNIINEEVLSKQNDLESEEKRINEFGNIFNDEVKSIFQDSISNLIRTSENEAHLNYQNGFYKIHIQFRL